MLSDRALQEIAWAGGLFEGEGCITTSSGRIVLRLKSTDEDTVIRFQEAIGAGTIYGPYIHHGNDGCVRKPAWVWVLYGDDVFDVLDRLSPWLGRRRNRRATDVRTSNDLTL